MTLKLYEFGLVIIVYVWFSSITHYHAIMFLVCDELLVANSKFLTLC